MKMEALTYKVIKNKAQYKDYCRELENLLGMTASKNVNERVDLLTVLIEKWDEDHNTFNALDPVQLLEGLMEAHQMKAVRLANILDVSRGLVSDILNYKKGMSKDVIRKLADHFKVSQEAFNRAYELKPELNTVSQKISHKVSLVTHKTVRKSQSAIASR